MQLPSGFCVGFCKKVVIILSGQALVRKTPCPVAGKVNRELLLSVSIASFAFDKGVIGSYSPERISVGSELTTGCFCASGARFCPHTWQTAMSFWKPVSTSGLIYGWSPFV